MLVSLLESWIAKGKTPPLCVCQTGVIIILTCITRVHLGLITPPHAKDEFIPWCLVLSPISGNLYNSLLWGLPANVFTHTHMHIVYINFFLVDFLALAEVLGRSFPARSCSCFPLKEFICKEVSNDESPSSLGYLHIRHKYFLLTF